MSNETLKQLSDAGVSIWLDDLSRERLMRGTLADLIRDKHGWMIDEMRSGCYVLSEALQQKSKC